MSERPEEKLLIINDDGRNIFALTAILRARGFTVLSAPGAEEGVALLRQHPDVRVVLLDMMMPDIDGYEAIPYLRHQTGLSDLPIVAVTAQAMTGDREKCLEAGANDYVSKPVDVDQLMTVLQTLK